MNFTQFLHANSAALSLLSITIIICAGLLYIISKQRQLQRATQQHAKLQISLAKLDSDLSNAQTQAHKFEAYSHKLQQQLQTERERHSETVAKGREQQALLQAERDKIEELKIQFNQQKQQLINEFKAISAQIITERQQQLTSSNNTGINALLQPLQQQLERFQNRVNQLHSETIKGNAELGAQINKVMEVGLKMRDDASDLTQALKGNSQQRGAWGEMQLERSLELCGLIDGVHYSKQAAFKNAEGASRQLDFLIKLPDGKHLIIDSKVSLIDFNRAMACTELPARQAALNLHAKAVKTHINQLADKNYSNLPSLDSPNFVLLFMPIEAAYFAALQHADELFNYGYQKNIILVAHSTLLPIMSTVANLWKLEQGRAEIDEISKCAGDIYNSVCKVSNSFKKLGDTLNTASSHYNQTVTYITGRQGLQGKVQRFASIANNIKQSMPAVEQRDFEYQSQNLQLPSSDA